MDLKLIGPNFVIYLYSKTNQMLNCIKFSYFEKSHDTLVDLVGFIIEIY